MASLELAPLSEQQVVLESQKTEIQCTVCMGILGANGPVLKCGSCQYHMCNSCWQVVRGKCPGCRVLTQPYEDLFLTNLHTRCEIVCQNSKYGEGCQWQGQYGLAKNHLEGKCKPCMPEYIDKLTLLLTKAETENGRINTELLVAAEKSVMQSKLIAKLTDDKIKDKKAFAQERDDMQKQIYDMQQALMQANRAAVEKDADIDASEKKGEELRNIMRTAAYQMLDACMPVTPTSASAYQPPPPGPLLLCQPVDEDGVLHDTEFGDNDTTDLDSLLNADLTPEPARARSRSPHRNACVHMSVF